MTATKRITLHAKKRTVLGKKVKKLRREGKLPANVFGKKIPSLAVVIDRVEFEKAYRIAGETQLIDFVVDGEKSPRPVLVFEVQVDPVSDRIIHTAFHQVDLTENVVANVPLRMVGVAPAEKNEQAVIVSVLNELAIEALPADIPEHIEVNIATLQHIGDAIHVRDLTLSAGVVSKEGADSVVVTAQEPKKEEVEAAPTVTEAGEVAEEAVPEAESAAAGAVTPSSTTAEKKPSPPPQTKAS